MTNQLPKRCAYGTTTRERGNFSLAPVIHLCAILSLAGPARGQLSPPLITAQPQSQSVSLGAIVTHAVQATGAPPLSYQWQFNGLDLAGATNAAFVLRGAQLRQAGQYTVVITNPAGSVTSAPASLEVDATFTKITDGHIVNDSGSSWTCAWGDYDGDGFIDLFASNSEGRDHFFYHNLGNGAFERIHESVVVTNRGVVRGCIWGDYNNDGNLDLFVITFYGNSFLFQNNGDGTFANITGAAPALDAGEHSSCAWGDYDNDGNLDLFISAHLEQNLLFQNNGDGTFARIFSGEIVNEVGHSVGCAWADYDNDGRLDLLVGNHRMPVFLYHNEGAQVMTKATSGRLASDINDAHGIAWGDYDNDGFLDVFFASEAGADVLYHNDGHGLFTPVPTNKIATISAHSYGCAWGDYDNDGFLDLFVIKAGQKNWLYHNNGDGTFSQVTSGSLANEKGYSWACAWGDYDNDGFIDLFVSNWAQNNFLYHNNGNRNNWLNIRCVGTASNRAAIGAKVRVQAMIKGKLQWQMREISGGSGSGQNDLRASIGLGDAAVADMVRIEWPSGIVQELHQVPAKQFLTLTEPPQLKALPILNGLCRIQVLGGIGWSYVMASSTNLADWTPETTWTAGKRITSWTHSVGSDQTAHFHRATIGE